MSIDGSLHKAPAGGEGTGPNPTDRGKTGWKWSVATDTNGVPIGWVTDGANRNDCDPAAPTLDAIAQRACSPRSRPCTSIGATTTVSSAPACVERGLADLHDRQEAQDGHRRQAQAGQPLGMRWPVERTNSWLSNFGQLRRNTDRFISHRLAQFALAVALIITVKLVKWSKRWGSLAVA